MLISITILKIISKRGVPLSKFRKIRDDIQILETSTIKQPLKKKDYLEKKLANVKKRQKYVDLMELKAKLENVNIILINKINKYD